MEVGKKRGNQKEVGIRTSHRMIRFEQFEKDSQFVYPPIRTFVLMNPTDLAVKVVSKMYDNDWFSQWLGIERLKVERGHCILRMTVRKDMLNGFAIAHGGITYSLADSALAFASNSHGKMAVSVETSISHTAQLKEGDVITATAEERSLSNKIGIYHVTVKNQSEEIVALFKGTVYRTGRDWFPVE
jgi:acyl-CoA thioesterase